MEIEPENGFVAFSDARRIAQGTLAEVAQAVWRNQTDNPELTSLTFNRATGAVFDLNLSGSLQDVVQRYSGTEPATLKRGRPKLGVVAREVTLLPRHWDWLAHQPGGASATLRRLVEDARKNKAADEINRERLAAAYKFMAAIAGDLPLFEEASRALFARKQSAFANSIASWPPDIRQEVLSFVAQIDWI